MRPGRPRQPPLLGAGHLLPVQTMVLRRHPAFVHKDRMENPGQKQHANGDAPPDAPTFFKSVDSRLHDSPQSWRMKATPWAACSTGRLGLSSKTLICSGLTIGLSEAKSIIPLPGARWSVPGGSTSWI